MQRQCFSRMSRCWISAASAPQKSSSCTETVKLVLNTVSGPKLGEIYTIEPGESLTFGRTMASAISFDSDNHMSGLHFEIFNSGDKQATVCDRGSRNGTWLNNKKVAEANIRDGDKLRAGTTVFTLEFSVSPSGTAVREREPNQHGRGERGRGERSGEELEAFDDSAFENRQTGRNGMEPNFPAARSPNSKPSELMRPLAAESKPRPQNSPLSSLSSLPPVTPELDSAADQVDVKPGPVDRPPPTPAGSDQPFGGQSEGGPQAKSSSKRPSSGSPIDFESVEFEQLGPGVTPHLTSPSAAGSAVPPAINPVMNSPISESSFCFDAPIDIPLDTERADKFAAHKEQYQLLRAKTVRDAAEGFAILIDSLSRKWSVQLILHFQKIRTVTPSNLFHDNHLFRWMSMDDAQQFSPVRLGLNELRDDDKTFALLPRLCMADACLAILGERPDAIARQIDRVVNLGIESFSEEGGLLPACWPSGLASIIDAKQTRVFERLFPSDVSGAIFCSPADKTQMMAIANSELCLDLADINFTPTDKVFEAKRG